MLAKGRLMADVELREYIAEIEGMLKNADKVFRKQTLEFFSS